MLVETLTKLQNMATADSSVSESPSCEIALWVTGEFSPIIVNSIELSLAIFLEAFYSKISCEKVSGAASLPTFDTNYPEAKCESVNRVSLSLFSRPFERHKLTGAGYCRCIEHVRVGTLFVRPCYRQTIFCDSSRLC